jgi:hypothetical protein
MGLLDAAAWQGNVFLAGVWVPGSGGDYPVVAPATGGELARMGRLTAADVEVAARSAAVAQAGWAATPHPQRGAAAVDGPADARGCPADAARGCQRRRSPGHAPADPRHLLHGLDGGCTTTMSRPWRPEPQNSQRTPVLLLLENRSAVYTVEEISPGEVLVIAARAERARGRAVPHVKTARGRRIP